MNKVTVFLQFKNNTSVQFVHLILYFFSPNNWVDSTCIEGKQSNFRNVGDKNLDSFFFGGGFWGVLFCFFVDLPKYFDLWLQSMKTIATLFSPNRAIF